MVVYLHSNTRSSQACFSYSQIAGVGSLRGGQWGDTGPPLPVVGSGMAAPWGRCGAVGAGTLSSAPSTHSPAAAEPTPGRRRGLPEVLVMVLAAGMGLVRGNLMGCARGA